AGQLNPPDPSAQEIASAFPAFSGAFDLSTYETFGSNNWVVSGRLSATGKPLLANDSHWIVKMPSVWYEMGLHCTPISDRCPYNFYGFGFPGGPGIIVGHNDRIGWGVTNSFTDVADVYLLTPNPKNPLQYMYNGSYVDMQVSTETLKPLNASPQEITLKMSRFGPVFDTLYGVNLGQPMAVRWAAADGNRSVDSILRFDRAANWAEFQQAIVFFDLPGVHVVYGDVDGNIGYVESGRIPQRVPGDDGSVPVPGIDGSHDWQGYVDPLDNPREFNPASG